ncbi:MAG TPA: metallophosphoesterase [Rhizomicrobium sp.]|nr:metallophosphoesterase [Rhizomicrobium sp.]
MKKTSLHFNGKRAFFRYAFLVAGDLGAIGLVLAGCAGAPQLAEPPNSASGQTDVSSYQWIQLGADGAAEIRTVSEGAACPTFHSADGAALILRPRAPADGKFPLVCFAPLPKGARAANSFSVRLPAVNPVPERIVVLGDTGCRLKGAAIQNCNNPKDWPFANVAAAAARLKPDLVIHLGDYQYRESPCPPANPGCAGTPYGDNWPAWKADFFAPAAPLLAAAPWVFVRGNHETCDRSGAGYLKMLGPLAYAPDCVDHQAPYRVPLGDFSLMVMDDADADDFAVNPAHVPVYQAELEDAVKPSQMPVWLVLHRPIWAASTGPLGIPAGGNAQIIAAAEKTMLTRPVSLMLAGHLHTFEAINYARGQVEGTPPPQIVAGNGGDALLVTPANLKGAAFQGHSGVAVKDGLSVGGFGFLLMTKSATGWTIDLYDAAGTAEGQCLFTSASDRLDCPKLPASRAAN